MNKTLATYMSLAATAVVIVGLLFNRLIPTIGELADNVLKVFQ